MPVRNLRKSCLSPCLFLLLVLGCAVDSDGFRQSEQRAVFYERAFLEPNLIFESPGTVRVCFLERTDHEAIPLADFQRISDLVDSTWGDATGLTFRYERLCSEPSENNRVTVYYRGDFDPTGNGRAVFGLGSRITPSEGNGAERFENRGDVQIYLGTSSNWTTVHEFGHALGFAHEWQEPLFQEAFPDCLDSINQESSDLDLDATRLTDADGDSITNYLTSECGSEGNNGYLTELDRVAAEILYPKDHSALSLRCSEAPCFNTAEGVVGYGSGTYTSAWIEAGVLPRAVRHYSLFNGATIDDRPAFESMPVNTSTGQTLDSSTWRTVSTDYVLPLLFRTQVLGLTGGAVGNRNVRGVVQQNRSMHTALLLTVL